MEILVIFILKYSQRSKDSLTVAESKRGDRISAFQSVHDAMNQTKMLEENSEQHQCIKEVRDYAQHHNRRMLDIQMYH